MDPQTLEKYTELALKVGVNLQPGQRLCIGRPPRYLTPIDAAPLVEVLTSKAYQMGARYVDALWVDEALTRLRFDNAPSDSFNEYTTWQPGAFRESIEREDAIIIIYGPDPELLSGVAQDRISTYMAALRDAYKDVMEFWVQHPIPWCFIAYPRLQWAKHVFPDHPQDQQVKRLWEAILKACYLNENDPIAYWRAHLERLSHRAAYLQERHYRSLEYSGPGTELTIGLPEGYIWSSAGYKSRSGISYVGNLPTEEVFTMPHRSKVEGTILATKPFVYAGQTIEGLTLTFRNGEVVEFDARNGAEYLRGILDTDEGSRRLGEVALVPHSSPISQSGILFYSLLFDENASSHLALGSAYRDCMHGGAELDDDAFQAAGGNVSFQHMDFMIGSDKLDVDGVLEEGVREPVMRSGEWAFDLS
jgi:aminopeptidase